MNLEKGVRRRPGGSAALRGIRKRGQRYHRSVGEDDFYHVTAEEKMACLSRKKKRKAERKKKKINKNQHFLERYSRVNPSSEVLKDITVQKREKKPPSNKEKIGKPSTKNTGDEDYPHSEKDASSTKKTQKLRREKDSASSKSKRELQREQDTATKKRPQEDAVMAREHKQLAQLEKQLKLKKRTSLPKSFIDDGLDFLLDVVDSKKLQEAQREREKLMGGSKPAKKAEQRKRAREESGDEESGPPSKKSSKRVHFQLDEDDNSDEDDSSDFHNDEEEGSDVDERSDEVMEDDEDEMEEDDDDGSMDEEEVMSDGEEEDGGDDAEEEWSEDDDDDDKKVKEDIYGRLVDSKGNLVSGKGQGGGAYVPPARRAAMLAGKGQEAVELERLKKQMKGLLNRASESNMQSISKSLEELYMTHSRASVNQALFSLVMEAVVSPVLTAQRLVAETAMLVAVLHGNVGSEVGAYFLQHVAKKYEDLRQLDQYGGEHTMDNVVLLLCYLYNFKIAHHTLVFEVMSQFVESFSEKDIELLLLILKSTGFYLRRDDPEALGNQITCIQQKARGLEESGSDVPARVRFMLEILVAIRNNNVRRVPGADTERTDRLRQLAGKFVRDGSLADNQLNIGLKDLLQAEDKGRWWIVGSAWEGRLGPDASSTKETAKGSEAAPVVGAVNQKLIHLAKKLRINSDIRRSIFFAIMSSEDYEDAFLKVLQLGLKGQQQQEIVVVAVLCAKRQAAYNPFYTCLLQKLALHERRFMIALQFHMWDLFRTMEELTSSGRKNLAAMLAQLLASKALSLSVLKVLEFGMLDKAVVKFLKDVFTTLITSTSLSDLKDIFKAVARLEKFRNLCDGLRMFLVKHVKMTGEDKKKLVEVCNELSLNHQLVM